mgnify:CR=1 FL=1
MISTKVSCSEINPRHSSSFFFGIGEFFPYCFIFYISDKKKNDDRKRNNKKTITKKSLKFKWINLSWLEAIMDLWGIGGVLVILFDEVCGSGESFLDSKF